MKSLKYTIAAIAAFCITSAASALSINGTLNFGNGNMTLDGPVNTATAVLSFDGTQQVESGTGFFSGVNNLPATFAPFSFGDTGFDLWSFTYNAVAYSLDVTSMNVNQSNPGILILSGGGDIFAAGDPEGQKAAWNITAQGNGTIVEVSLSSFAETVPDSGASAVLLGLGLVGLGAAARRFRK